VSVLVLVVDDEPDVEALFRQQFRRDLRAQRFVMDFANSAAEALARIAECQRREGHYEQALATLKKAQALSTDSDEILFNESLTYDALGRYPESTQILNGLVTRSAKPDNHYNDGEKNNRSIFLDRLANVEREQNHTEAAVNAYKQLVALGGEYAERGYQGEVDAYRDAKEYEKATIVAREAAKALPGNKSMQLMLAGQLADTGHAEEGLALAEALEKSAHRLRPLPAQNL